MEPTKYTIDYLAGIFDGEGSVSISVSARKDRPNSHFMPCVTVANTYKPVVDWFMDKYGGYIRVVTPPSGNTVYQWQLRGGKGIRIFAGDFLEHIHIKRKELLVLLEFLDHAQHLRATRPRNSRYDQKIIAGFLEYRDRLRELHSSTERYDDPTS